MDSRSGLTDAEAYVKQVNQAYRKLCRSRGWWLWRWRPWREFRVTQGSAIIHTYAGTWQWEERPDVIVLAQQMYRVICMLLNGESPSQWQKEECQPIMESPAQLDSVASPQPGGGALLVVRKDWDISVPHDFENGLECLIVRGRFGVLR